MILAAQLAREAGDDFVLHAEKVGEGSVKAVGPQTRAASTSCALFTRPSGIVETDSVTACASSSLFAATFGLLLLVADAVPRNQSPVRKNPWHQAIWLCHENGGAV